MPEFPYIGGGGRLETAGALPGTSLPTGVSAHATANTKGSYAQLIASSAFDASGMILTGRKVSGFRDVLLDIAVGAAASEQDIVSNVLFSGRGAYSEAPFFPIAVPAGSRISARAQDSSGGGSETALVHLIPATFLSGPLFSRSTTYGASTSDSGGVSVDPGVTAHTKGAYSQIDASISNSCKSLLVAFGTQANSATATANWLFDIAVGAAASEQVVIADIHVNVTSFIDMQSPAFFGPIPVNIPAATRVAVRSQCSINDATDRLLDVVIYGFD